MKDLMKRRFGRLTVTRKTNRRYRGKIIWECLCDCGNITYIISSDLLKANTKSCGCLRLEVLRNAGLANKGKTCERNPNWKGGKRKDNNGYIQIHTPCHPFANCVGYVPEHRLVMEKIKKRYLTSDEVVHHANGIKGDNSEENLVLFASSGLHLTYHAKLRRIAEYT